ncbi:MAG: HAD family hydrolase [Cyanophyceae cyanobacterium]
MVNSLINLAGFDALIFDLGGVIINLDYQRTINDLSAHCGFDVASLYTQQAKTDLFNKFEAGLIEAVEFRAGLRSLLKLSETQLSDRDLDTAWNALILDVPVARLEFLKSLQKTPTPTFLLSNNNAIHKGRCDELLRETTGDAGARWDDYFVKAYFSHEMGDRKPNASIFQRVIDEQQLDPERTLFLEDTPKNIAGARSLGLKTLQITAAVEIAHLPYVGLV